MEVFYHELPAFEPLSTQVFLEGMKIDHAEIFLHIPSRMEWLFLSIPIMSGFCRRASA